MLQKSKLPIHIPVVKTILLAVATVIILSVLLVTFTSLEEIQTSFYAIDAPLLFTALFLLIMMITTAILRWYSILRTSNVKLPFGKVSLVVLGAWLFTALPGKIGDFLRSYFLRSEVPTTTTISTVAFEKILDLLSLLLLSIVGLLYLENYTYVLLLALSAGSIILTILYGSIVKKVLSLKLSNLFDKVTITLKMVPTNMKWFTLSLLSSLASRFFSVTLFYFIVIAFGTEVPLSVTLAYLPLALVIGILPISIAGIGTRDAAILALFTTHASGTTLLLASLLYTFFTYILLTLVALPFFLYTIQKSK